MKRRVYTQPILVGGHRHAGRITTLYPDPIHDAEAFCAHYAEQAFRTWGMYLPVQDDWTDTIQELLRHLLRMEQLFDPERNDSFANYARTYLPKRAVDAGPRRLLGRSGSRVNDYLHDELDESAARRGLDETQPPLESDPDPDRRPDAGGLQPDRARDRAWAHCVLGL